MINVVGVLHGEYTSELGKLAIASTTVNINSLLESLRVSYTANKLIEVSNAIQTRIKDAEDISMEILDIERDVLDVIVGNRKQHRDEGTIGDYLDTYMQETKRMMTERGMIGVPTYFSRMDSLMGGLRGGDNIVIAGRSGMGKSSFAATMMAKQIMGGYKPAIFSFELGRKEFIDKLFSHLSEFDGETKTIDFKKLYNPAGNMGGASLNSGDFQAMKIITEKYLKNNQSFLRGTSRTTIDEVLARARKLKAEGGCDILYIDHIGLLVQDKNKATAELTHITNSLKIFAAEEDIPVVSVVQLRRDADTVKEKPKLSHLKGSGSIEEDANIVIMPWRPYAIHNDINKNDPSESEILVVKSRNSGTGSIPAFFSTHTTSFVEVEEAPEW